MRCFASEAACGGVEKRKNGRKAGNLHARLFPERLVRCRNESVSGKRQRAKKQTADVSAGKPAESKPQATIDSDGFIYSFDGSPLRALKASAKTPFGRMGSARSLLRQLGRSAASGIDVFKASRFGLKAFSVKIRKLPVRELAKARSAGRHGGSPVGFKINVHEVPVHKTLFSFRRDEFCDFGVCHGCGFGAGIELHREFPKEKTPLRSVARAKEPDACRRRADKARRRQVTDLERKDGERGRKSREDASLGENRKERRWSKSRAAA